MVRGYHAVIMLGYGYELCMLLEYPGGYVSQCSNLCGGGEGCGGGGDSGDDERKFRGSNVVLELSLYCQRYGCVAVRRRRGE